MCGGGIYIYITIRVRRGYAYIHIVVDFSLLLNQIEWNYTFHIKLA